MHHRFAPREHRFTYRLFYLAVDLDELPGLDRRLRLFSANRGNVYSLKERDFLPLAEPVHHASIGSPRVSFPRAADASSEPSLRQRALAFCRAHGVTLNADARVQLVTLPRCLGYAFNPVSFYFCAEADGPPRAAIAEVTNTFREVKPYFVPLGADSGSALTFRLRVPKHFYVSPFSAVDVDFDFRLRAPDDRLAIQIDDYQAGSCVLHSTLVGSRAAVTDARLAWYLLKYPCLTLLVVARIHWQALRLWLRRIPFFRKAHDGARQRDLYRPAGSPTGQPHP